MLRLSALAILTVSAACAAPMLRLSSATVGPISIAAGANGTTQLIELYNAGDGSLAPTATASVSWIAPSIGAAGACTTRIGTCIPLNLALNTASLAAGMYTATVMVTDPNAVDSPQSITVTVQIGGGVPNAVTLYAPPGGTVELPFTTNSRLVTAVSTQNGQRWLSVGLDSVASFSFSFPYFAKATALAGMGTGIYDGSVTVTGSTFAPDNKTVPVVLQVTNQPIAQVAPQQVQVRLAPGAPAETVDLVLSNSGLGTLSIGGTTSAGGSWISVSPASGLVVPIVLDPSNLAAGVYQGSVTVNTNAVNSPATIPVELDVAAPAPPLSAYQGVVDISTFAAGPVASGDIVAVFGEQYLYAMPASGTQLPLVTTLSGVQVLVNGQAAPLYYVSYGQINFEVPFETPVGPATVSVSRDGQAGNIVSITVAPAAPRILTLYVDDYGIIVNNADGSFAISAATASSTGLKGHPAKEGDALVIYAVGFGQTSPAVATGAPAPSATLARITPTPIVNFDGTLPGTGRTAVPLFAGLTPGIVGLYQINVVVPSGVSKGDTVPLTITANGVTSNQANLAIQ